MDVTDLTSQFYKKIESAVAYWNLGERENMIDLLCAVHADGFAEGCDHTKECIKDLLDTRSGTEVD